MQSEHAHILNATQIVSKMKQNVLSLPRDINVCPLYNQDVLSDQEKRQIKPGACLEFQILSDHLYSDDEILPSRHDLASNAFAAAT